MKLDLAGLLQLLSQFTEYNTTGKTSIALTGPVNGTLTITRDAQGRMQFGLSVTF